MSTETNINGLNCGDFFKKLYSENLSEIFSDCPLHVENNMSQFSRFILNHAASINYPSLAQIIHTANVLYSSNGSILKEIDQLSKHFIMKKIQKLPGRFNLTSTLLTAKEAITHLQLFGEEFENERLEIAKLILSQIMELKDYDVLAKIFKEIALNDNSKFELFKLAIQRISNNGQLRYLHYALENCVVNPKYYVEGLKWAAHHIDKNPVLFSEDDKITHIYKKTQALQIFEVDREFFIQLFHQFKNSQLFERAIKSLKKNYLEYFCEKIPVHVFININTWNIEPLDSLDKRLSLAESCFNQDRQVFAEYLLNVFTEDEVINNPKFFNPKIEACLSSIPEDDARYLMKVKQYLVKYKEQRTYEQDCLHWDCIGEFPPGSGILTFKLKWTYHKESKARAIKNLTYTTESDNDLIFPAVEPYLETMSPDMFEWGSNINRLGFDYQTGQSGAFLSIPTIDTLTTNWEKLRLEPEYAKLPPLSLAISDGIASTQEFVALLDDCDVVVSKNKEFVHDMIFHVLSTIKTIFVAHNFISSKNQFLDLMERMRAIGRKTNANIERVRSIYTTPEEFATLNIISESVGILYDLVTSAQDLLRRTAELDKFESGIFFYDIFGPSDLNKDPSANFVKYFWKIDLIRRDMIALGVPPNTAPENLHEVFPYQKLQEMWKKIYRIE